MDCEQAQGLLGDHSAGILSGQMESALFAHLKECAVCEREHRRFNRMMEALNRLPRPEPPSTLWPGIRARLDLERAVRENAGMAPPGKPASIGWAPALLTAAAGFLVTIGLLQAGGPRRDAATAGELLPPPAVTVAATNTIDATLPTLDTTAVTVMDSFAMRPVPPVAEEARSGARRGETPREGVAP